MGQGFGLPTALFAVKCYVAAMLALYISLSIGLERPYWAFLTSFIVAQPLAGAVISKALFRLIGTFVGGVAAVAMVPPLVNAPELLTLAIASWLAICVFVSLLDRTPRAYMFVLAGYSACIIALPSVDAPGEIFTVAILRVQEIGIGILCSSLVHGVVMPGSITRLLLSRVDAMLGDAERWSRDAIATTPVPELEAERRRLALDVTELHQLSIHLPFDPSRLAPRVRTVRALQDQLSMLLPLGAAVQDRLENFQSAGGTVSPEVTALIDDCRAWLAAPEADPAERHTSAEALIARCTALEPEAGPETSWTEMLRLSLLARLGALIAVHRDCRDLRDQLITHRRQPVTPRVAELLGGRRNRELHRDYAGAARGAFGAFVTILLGCALWIGSGWADGSTAVMLAGVFLALFSAFDNALAPLKGFMIGTLIATVLGAIYGFAILPMLDGFWMLALALAPVLLVGGALMSSPRYGGIALPAMMGMGSPALLAATYSSDFASYANGSIAQLVGTWFAIVMTALMQAAGAHHAIRRTIRAGWADIAQRANLMRAPDVRGWINRMLDRIGLLAPRLAAIGEDSGRPLYDALRDLRTGVAIGELRQLRLDLPPGQGDALTEVLSGVADYYRGLDPDLPPPSDPTLLDRIDGAIAATADYPQPAFRREGTLGLVSLRRNLFPEAASYRRAA
ncbi:putative membrane protein YccC [Sphingomonas kyeonggiensis]|uniref:Putative membrane protein YccC n=1 Tax=Sphingomonas kyeonggiensis TaxID=1268553 RepID=A0A7W7K3B9_9SPHN|nr:FUSC family protein [Sphingomonas kyeonggiensis]MBB4840311.1 putative membrane protein YccC [Sphingomonas kyeonggiensis]